LVKFKKIIETCIYTLDLEKLKDFYVNGLGLEFVSEEENRSVFLKAGKSMLLIFNPNSTLNIRGNVGQSEKNKVSHADLFPPHGALTPPSVIHFALEIDESEYDDLKKVFLYNNIEIEKEVTWNNEMSKSLYFRDPSGNLVEIIMGSNLWPVDD
jgi:catechol 2,3-dioxygenase-like lactoylglutathione lyase family enzyme